MSELENNTSCYNCKAPITGERKFCSSCGQKHHNGKYSVGRLITDFLANNFNLDTKLAQTTFGLMRPGFLTKEYFRGAHVKYFRPLRLFLVLNVFLIFLLGILGEGPDVNNDFAALIEEDHEKYKDELLWDSLRIVIKTQDLDTNALAFLDSMQVYSHGISKGNNELSVEDDLLKLNFDGVIEGPIEDSMFVFDRGIPTEEFLEMPSDEIVKNYFEDFPWWHKVLLSKGLKLGLDVKAMLSFIFSQLPFFLLVFAPFNALVYVLLYWRKKMFYVEHFVFVLHLGSFNVLIGIIGVVFLNMLEVEDWFLLILLAIWVAYYLFSLKRYYLEGWGWTVFKFLLATALSGILGIIAFVVFLGISFLMF